MWSSGRKLTFPSNANRRVNSNTTRFKSMAKHFILPQLQSDLAITDVKNKVSVIARSPRFKFVRYSKVRLAGERLEKRPVYQGFRYNEVRYRKGRLYILS